MKAGGGLSKAASRVLVALLAVAMVFTMMPLAGSQAYAESGSALSVQKPALVVTGKGLIGDEGVYSSSNVSKERSYTIDELKSLGEGYVVNRQKYSAMKNSPFTKNNYLVDGVKVAALLGKEESEITDNVYVEATDGYKVEFLQDGTYSNGNIKTLGINNPRYFYTFTSAGSPGHYDEPEGEKGDQVPAVIGWADVSTNLDGGENIPTALPEGETSELGFLRLYVGQLGEESGGAGVRDRNQPLFNGKSVSTQINKVREGDVIDEVVLTVGSKTYTRADILMMDFAEATYSYSTSNGDKTDTVRGVPFSVLLNGEDGNSQVSFEAADGYDMSSSTKTVQELIDGNYMLAYQANGNGIYEKAKSGNAYGMLTLYGDGAKPAKMVNKVTVTTDSGIDFSTSPYKHITNGGQGGSSPYNIDSITGATLTVEGPGVKTSVPVSVRDLEGRDAGAVRADYTDKREGSNITRKYEGIDLYYILHNMSNGDNGIKMTDLAKRVLIKNRNRSTIAEFTVEQIEEAHNSSNPIIVAYGTSYANGDNPRPFVFNNADGADPDLGNEDGCIKLVYDKGSITGDTNTGYTTFGNMAYIYVAQAETPGYKHDKDPYQSPEISNYVLTVTGDKIGREVNYTVRELEGMVAYGDDGKPDNSGMGYRDEYSLANSTYWYVNEYEGVQLWKLLLKSGLDPALASDDETIVSSTATDGYPATDKFTVKQVADPNSFGFYEKNPKDPNTEGWSDENNEVMRDPDHPDGDLIARGYPVLVAYGVNGYPYVEKSSQDGYLSGLQNDGGPLRVISGKKQYNHPNGSNQAKLLDKIIVGDNTYHYSTHKYHSDVVYNSLAENEISVRILNGAGDDAPVLKEESYTIGDIEDYIYGGKLTRNQLAVAKIKQFYELTKGSTAYSDLYEGINLNFFLENIVELPGYKGTITFSDGTNKLTLDLEDVLATDNGSNEETGVSGLPPVLAYGKNGAPMVFDKYTEGYQNKITLAEGTEYEGSINVKNDGGPLAVLFPRTENSVSGQSLTNVTSVTVNLSADSYSHSAEPYNTYADYEITIGGEGTRLGAEGKAFKLSELEGKQTIAFTGDYSILNSSGTVSQARYRGINLYSLLTSTSVGLKSNADKVIITTTDGMTAELTLSEARKSDYVNTITGADNLPVLLAYGAGKAGTDDKEDGLPLVLDKNSDGYDKAYGNNGGPVRLVVGQKDADDANSGSNLKYVKSIEVTASEMVSWNHNSSEVFKQYRNETVDLIVNDKAGNELFKKTFTVGEIEDNTSLVERIVATVTQEFTWEGINFWAWVKQEAGSVEGLDDPVSVTVTAADNFSQEIRNKFGMDALINGIKDANNYVPIILAYGVGGYPLVIGPNSEGFDATAMNNGGPLRLITHNSQGTSITYVKKIVVVAGDGSSQPEEPADFTIKGIGDNDITLSVEEISNLKNSAGDIVGQAEGTYTTKGVTKKVRGVLLKNLLTNYGVSVDYANITMHTPDGFETIPKGASYNDISYKQTVDQKYFLAYQEWDETAADWKDIDDIVKGTDTHTKLRMYRNYCEANGLDNQTEWLDECTNITSISVEVPEVVAFKEYPTRSVRSTWMDKDGTVWVGTYGGGLFYKEAGEKAFEVLNTSSDPALMTDFTSAVAADAEGGIWVSQNASYTEPGNNQGVLYIKDGEVTQYTVEANPGTIADNYVQAIKVDTDGKVWFGSFGGVTIYDPAEDSWVTYSKADKEEFPATSVCTITLDGEGGAWLGFYPDGSGTEDDPYAGGFCHITADGTVGNVVNAGGVGDPQFAQSWVRSIVIDNKGTLWAVAAGTNIEDNVGGVIWKWKSGNDAPERYTGREVLGDYLDGNNTTEVRVVAVDADGALWFGTSADGVLKVDNPKLNDGKMTVTAQYAKETGSWSAANMNNVYSINFWNGNTAYVGTAGGLMVLGKEPGEKDVIGGETEETAQFIVDGKGTVNNGYFSIKSLKNTEGINKVDASYSWMNKSGTTGRNSFQGVYLDNLLRDVIGITDDAYKLTVIASDGYSKTIDLYRIDETDIDGNKMMIAWQSDEDPTNTKIDPKLVIGQKDENDKNKSSWISNVKEVRVDVATAEDMEAVEQARQEAAAEIAAYADSITFSEDHQASVAAITDSIVEEINAADYVSKVEDLLSKGKGRLDAVRTIEEKEAEIIEKQEEAAEAERAADEAQAAAAQVVDNGDEEAVAITEEAVTAAEESLEKAEAVEAAANAALEAAQTAGDEELIAAASEAAEAAHTEKLIQLAKTTAARTTASRAKAVIARAEAAEAAATPGEEAVQAAQAAEAAAAEVVENAAQAVTDAEAALAAAGEGAAKEKAQEVLDAAKAAKAAADIALADARFEELKEEAKNTLLEVAAAAKEGLSEEAAARIDTELQGALAQLSEVRSVDNFAPITAKLANDINGVAEQERAKAEAAEKAEREKALAEKKNSAMQALVDYLDEKTGKADLASMTKVVLDAIVAVNNAADIAAVDEITNTAKADIDTIIAKTPPAKTAVTLKNIAVRKVKVTWKKISGAAGYEVYRSAKKSSGFKKIKTVKSGKTVSYTNSKLKKGKAYYYKVRAYKVYNGKKIYGKFSTVKKITVKK